MVIEIVEKYKSFLVRLVSSYRRGLIGKEELYDALACDDNLRYLERSLSFLFLNQYSPKKVAKLLNIDEDVVVAYFEKFRYERSRIERVIR